MKRYDPKIKLFISQSTDTNQDAIDAMKAFSKVNLVEQPLNIKFTSQQESQIIKILEEKDENILELQKALKMKSEIVNKEYSGATEKLKSIHKQLAKKTYDFEMAFAEAQKEEIEIVENEMGQFVDYVKHCYADIQTETYQAVLKVFNELLKRQSEKKKEQQHAESAQVEKSFKQRQKDLKQGIHSSEKSKNKFDLVFIFFQNSHQCSKTQKIQELELKHEEIALLNMKLKEMRDLTLNSDAEIEFLRSFQFRLENDKTKLQIEIRRLEKQLIASKEGSDVAVQVNEPNLQDQQLIALQQTKISQQQYENQALNQKIQNLLEQIARLQEQNSSQSPYQKSQNKSQSPNQKFFNSKQNSVNTNQGYQKKQKKQKKNQSEQGIFQQGSIDQRAQVEFTDEDQLDDITSEMSLGQFQKPKLNAQSLQELDNLRRKSKTPSYIKQPQQQVQTNKSGGAFNRKTNKSPTQKIQSSSQQLKLKQMSLDDSDQQRVSNLDARQNETSLESITNKQQQHIHQPSTIKEESEDYLLNSQDSYPNSARNHQRGIEQNSQFNESNDTKFGLLSNKHKNFIQKQSSFGRSANQLSQVTEQSDIIIEGAKLDKIEQTELSKDRNYSQQSQQQSQTHTQKNMKEQTLHDKQSHENEETEQRNLQIQQQIQQQQVATEMQKDEINASASKSQLASASKSQYEKCTSGDQFQNLQLIESNSKEVQTNEDYIQDKMQQLLSQMDIPEQLSLYFSQMIQNSKKNEQKIGQVQIYQQPQRKLVQKMKTENSEIIPESQEDILLMKEGLNIHSLQINLKPQMSLKMMRKNQMRRSMQKSITTDYHYKQQKIKTSILNKRFPNYLVVSLRISQALWNYEGRSCNITQKLREKQTMRNLKSFFRSLQLSTRDVDSRTDVHIQDGS